MTKTAPIHSVGFRTGKTAEDLRVRTENYLARGAHISPVPVRDAITAWECLLETQIWLRHFLLPPIRPFANVYGGRRFNAICALGWFFCSLAVLGTNGVTSVRLPAEFLREHMEAWQRTHLLGNLIRNMIRIPRPARGVTQQIEIS